MKRRISNHLTIIVGLAFGILAAVIICGFYLLTHLAMATYFLSFIAVIVLGMTAPWPVIVKWCQYYLDK